MRGLLNKVSNPLKIRHTLDCIAGDINYLNTYLHIYIGDKIVICQLRDTKLNFLFTAKTKIPIWQIYSYI